MARLDRGRKSVVHVSQSLSASGLHLLLDTLINSGWATLYAPRHLPAVGSASIMESVLQKLTLTASLLVVRTPFAFPDLISRCRTCSGESALRRLPSARAGFCRSSQTAIRLDPLGCRSWIDSRLSK